MQYNLFILISLALVGLAAAVPRPFTSRLSWEDENNVNWLRRVVTEKERWDFISTDAIKSNVEDDADIISALAAYTSSWFNHELAHYYKSKDIVDDSVEDFDDLFRRYVSEPCAQAKIHSNDIGPNEKSPELKESEEICEKVLADRIRLAQLAYDVARSNSLIPTYDYTSRSLNVA